MVNRQRTERASHTTLRALFASYLLAMLGIASPSHSQISPTAAALWYRQSRALELTGASPRDSIVLTATGKRADSLAILMTFYVAGVAAHRQRWTSDDELADADSLRVMPAQLASFMRTRLDDVLQSVRRQPINREQVSHMGHEAALRKITPRPTHQVMLSFGFENSLFFAWNPTRREFVLFMECC